MTQETMPIQAQHSTISHTQNMPLQGTPVEQAQKRYGNLFDYIDWRGDVPMSVDPFNEVDNLVLSTLVYAPFDGIVPGEDSFDTISIDQANVLMWNKFRLDSMDAGNPALKFSPFLLKKLRNTRRFGGVRLSAYINEVDADDQYQLAALTYTLEDGTYYAAFRGTDDSIAGWREDMNLSYMAMTRGQERAVEYLNRRFGNTNQYVRVGGHSKGGNLAVYAAMYCIHEVQDRIIEVWSNDGPGFIQSITSSDDYLRICPRIKKLIPEESVVGILLDSGIEPAVIQSTMDGVMQHSPFSWKIKKNRILRAKKLSGSSTFFGKTANDWISSLDPDNKKVFIEVLFDAIQTSGAETIGEFTDDPVRAYNAFYKTIKDLPQDKRATMLLVLQKLAESGTNQVIQGLMDKLSGLARKLYD